MEISFAKYSSDLDEYIAKTKSRLSAILSALEWNEEETLKESTCSGHVTSKEDKEDPCDPLLPESFESMHSIVIDEEKLKEIVRSPTAVIPKKFSDIQLNFTREQKLAVYDYVVKNTGKISEPELKVSIASGSQGVNDMTFAEIVAKAKKKDKKLKRKYRTSKPTHIEEVRNLVHLQMEALAQYFNPKPDREENDHVAGRRDIFRSRKRSRSPRSSKKIQSHSRDRKRSKLDRDWSHNRYSRNWALSKERSGRSKDSRSRSNDRRRRSKHRRSHSKDRRSPSKERKSHYKERRSRSKDRRHSKKTKKHSKSRHKSSKSKKSKHHRKSKDKH